MRRVAAALAAAACLLLAGCASTVTLAPAPDATSVGCASVVVGLPQTIAQADRRTTDAQGTAAWGTPASVTLRCGVTTPQVSALPCFTQDDVDWLRQTVGGNQVLTTYGRTPGVQVIVSEPTSVSDVVQAISGAVADGARGSQKVCLSDPGLSATSGTVLTPTPTPTPTPTS